MDNDQAIQLIKESLSLIENPSGNLHGGTMKVGGIYRRLSRVLVEYIDPMLEEQEGKEHAGYIRVTSPIVILKE